MLKPTASTQITGSLTAAASYTAGGTKTDNVTFNDAVTITVSDTKYASLGLTKVSGGAYKVTNIATSAVLGVFYSTTELTTAGYPTATNETYKIEAVDYYYKTDAKAIRLLMKPMMYSVHQ
jgi:hypothetical protein